MKILKIIVFTCFLMITYLSFANNYNITDFGARPGMNYNSTAAIQAAIDKASETGGQVYFPKGEFYTGTVYLKDNTTIYLDFGSFWKGFNDSTVYHYIEPKVKTRMDLVPFKSFIYGQGKKNIKIYGNGTIHPSGELEIFIQKHISEIPKRPYGLQLVECSDIKIEGIRFTNGAFWMIRLLNCDNVYIHNISIFNHSNVNNDGIDIDGCHNVLITGCKIDCEDDAVCIKSEGARTSEDIMVSNCIISSFATAFKLGTGSIGGFNRIIFSDCIIKPSIAKINHHPFKAWGGIAGIDLLCVDGGIMEDVQISNIIIKGVETPLFIKLGNRNSRVFRINTAIQSQWEDAPELSKGIVRRIIIQNIISTESGPICSIIDGYKDALIEKVMIRNCYFEISRAGTKEDIKLNANEKPSAYPCNRMYGQNLPAYGFYIRYAQDIELENIRFSIPEDEPRPAIVCENVLNSTFKEITGGLNSKGLKLIVNRECKNLRFEQVKLVTIFNHKKK